MKLQNNFLIERFIITVNDEAFAFGLNQVLYVRYLEDIESASILMEVQLTDTASGILSKLTGLESVFIEIFDGARAKIGGFFTIYNIQDRVNDGVTSKATLMLCTPDFINNAAMKISRKFGDKKIHEIVVDDILKNIMGTVVPVDTENIEPTFNKYSFVSPFWCPFTIISWLAGKSIAAKGSSKSASAGYTFFQNRRGYNFKSYDSFTTEEPTKRIIVNNLVGELKEDDELDVLSVKKMRVVSNVDVLKGLNIGSYASNVMTLDLYNMEFTETKFDINKYYEDVPRLNNSPTPLYFKDFSKDTAPTRIMSKIVDTALFSKGTHTDGITKQLSQAALREKLFYNKIVEVEFIGYFDLTVGDVVQLDVYKGRAQEPDAQNSGKYVISRVDRTFFSSNDTMGTKLTLTTDSPGA
tara:strand:+ start:315 stop:1547 length:1233 start_codon:yes stop_codon:yes gene_type:complete